MAQFDPNSFSKDPSLVFPYEEICDGFSVGFDRETIKNGTTVSARTETLIYDSQSPKPALVLDGANFKDSWSALEFQIAEEFQSLKFNARFFPMQQLFPRFYCGGDTYDFDIINVSDIGGEVRFERSDLGDPFPGAGTLAFLLPTALWFSIALFELELNNAAH